jgi:hypothetical protein
MAADRALRFSRSMFGSADWPFRAFLANPG